MITPPFATPSFYVVMFEKPVAQVLSSLLAPTFSKDIETAMLNSIDIATDIQATVEMKDAANLIIELAGVLDVDQSIEFNPMYLPAGDNTLDDVELDFEGNIKGICGFDNPFVSAKLTASSPEFPVFMDARINYQKFDLPDIKDLFSKNNGVRYS